MEMFDAVIETTIKPDGTAQVKTVREEGDQSGAMRDACHAFVCAERRFRKLDENPACVTDPALNLQWWDALESMYLCDKTCWRLFVGPQPDLRSNMLYAKFRELLLKGSSSLKANA